MQRSLQCKTILLALLIAVCASTSVAAQTWLQLPMTFFQGILGETLNSNPPFVLGWPTTAAPSLRFMHSDMQSNVKGIRFRGDFKVFGSGTNLNNHMALFFSTDPNYAGDEYGLILQLPSGKLKLYQCHCGVVDELWAESIVMSPYPADGQYLAYQIFVNPDGSFKFEARKPWAPYTLVASKTVAKASWAPNLYNATGNLTAVAWRYANDGSNWVPSAMHLDSIEFRQ